MASGTTSNPLILGENAVKIYNPSKNIIANYSAYEKANIDNTGCPKTFYVVYDKEDFGHDYPSAGSCQSNFVPSSPLSGLSDPITTAYSIASAQGFDLQSPSIILFEHIDFIGHARQFTCTDKDITQYFPAGQTGGVSSMIVVGGTWKMYGANNLLLDTLTQGCYSFIGNDKNDMVQSIELVNQ